MRKILSYTIPPIKCFMHHVLPLGVFWDENDPEIMNWFCMNYNYIMTKIESQVELFTFFANFNSIPFLQKRDIYGDELENYLADHSFPSLVKMMIDNGNLIEVIVDMSYMQNVDFEEKYTMHEILILGYDDEKDTFIIQGYFKNSLQQIDSFQQMEVPQSQVVPYENCAYYGDNVVMMLYRKKTNIFPFDKKGFLLQLSDYYNSVNPYGRVGFVNGTYFEPWERVFGMEAYDRMKEYIENTGQVDYREMRVVQEHFNAMKMKLNYLKSKGYLKLNCLDKMIACYTEASMKAEMMVLTAVKYMMGPKEKKEKLKQSVLSQFQKLIDGEKVYLKEFLQEAYSQENGCGSGCGGRSV